MISAKSMQEIPTKMTSLTPTAALSWRLVWSTPIFIPKTYARTNAIPLQDKNYFIINKRFYFYKSIDERKKNKISEFQKSLDLIFVKYFNG